VSTKHGPAFWIALVAGWVCIAAGIRGVLIDAAMTRPRLFLRWFAGPAIVHDALFAPAAVVLAWLVDRWLPRRFGTPLKVGTGLSVVLVLFSWPLVRGYGKRRNLPSALPLDYGHNVVWGLVAIWVVMLAWALLLARVDRREPERSA